MKYKLEIKLPNNITQSRYDEIHNSLLKTLNAQDVYNVNEMKASGNFQEYLIIHLSDTQEPSINSLAIEYKKILIGNERKEVKPKVLETPFDPALALYEDYSDEADTSNPNYDYDECCEIIDTITFDEFWKLKISGKKIER